VLGGPGFGGFHQGGRDAASFHAGCERCVFGGCCADGQSLADLGVGQAAGEQVEDFAFARAAARAMAEAGGASPSARMPAAAAICAGRPF